VLTPPPIRSATDILMVTTMALLWTVTNSSLGEQLVWDVMQVPAESFLQCKRQFARRGQISEFYIFAPPNAAPAQCRPRRMPPFPPLPAAPVFQLLRSTQPGRPSVDRCQEYQQNSLVGTRTHHAIHSVSLFSVTADIWLKTCAGAWVLTIGAGWTLYKTKT